jgi:hypothetical protein
MELKSVRSGVASLTACAFFISIPGPECWAAVVRTVSVPSQAGAPALGGLGRLRQGIGLGSLSVPVRLSLSGPSGTASPTLSGSAVQVAAPGLADVPAPLAAAAVPVVQPGLPAQGAGPVSEAAPAVPLQARLEAAAQEGLRPGRDASFLSRVFDGSGSAAAPADLPGEPVLSAEEPASGPGPALAEPAPSRSRLALLKEMAFGQPEVAPLLKPYRWQMNAARAMLILKGVLSTALAYSVGAMVDAALAHSLPAAGMWLGAIAALTAVKAVNYRFYSVTVGSLRVRVRRDFRIKLFAGLLGISDPGESSGKLAARLTADVSRVTVKNVTIPIHFPHLVIQVVLGAAFVVKASPLMAGVMLGFLPLLGWLAWRYGRRSAALQESASTEGAALTHAGAKALAGAPLPEEARAQAVAGYERKAARYEKTMLDYLGISANFEALREFIQTACTEILILGVGLTSFILTGAPTVGQVMSLRGYAKDLRGAVDGFVDAYTEGKDAEGGTRRILELLRRVQPPAPAPPDPAQGR